MSVLNFQISLLKFFKTFFVGLIEKNRTPLVAKISCFNLLVWYPELAHLSASSIYLLYISVVANSVAITNTYTKMSFTSFSNIWFLLYFTTS